MKQWLCLFLATAFSLNAAQFTDEQKSEIGTIIREYLIENPEVIVESVQVFQKRQQEKQAEQSQRSIYNFREEIFTKGPVLGNENGSIVMVEFLDYNCPHCRTMHAVVEELINENQDLKVVIKELPILGQPSLLAAKAALQAEKSGKFEELHAAFMNEKDKLTEERIKEIANEFGLDVGDLDQGIDQLSDVLQSNLELAIGIGVQATPVFIVAPAEIQSAEDIFFIPGGVPKAFIQSKIDEVRKK